jgi:hypothetical protein
MGADLFTRLFHFAASFRRHFITRTGIQHAASGLAHVQASPPCDLPSSPARFPSSPSKVPSRIRSSVGEGASAVAGMNIEMEAWKWNRYRPALPHYPRFRSAVAVLILIDITACCPERCVCCRLFFFAFSISGSARAGQAG